MEHLLCFRAKTTRKQCSKININEHKTLLKAPPRLLWEALAPGGAPDHVLASLLDL